MGEKIFKYEAIDDANLLQIKIRVLLQPKVQILSQDVACIK